MTAEAEAAASRRPSWEWLLLFALLALLLVAATLRGRPAGRSLGDEATWVAQAESLATDFDRRYGGADRERAGADRPALRLVEGSAGDPAFRAPLPYSLFLAPFVRLAPERGVVLANALLLIWTALFVSHRLARRLGDSAPLLVALLIFGSLTFVYVAVGLPTLFLLAATATAFALAYGWEEPSAWRADEIYRPPEAGARRLARWLAVGLLLALPALHDPLYLLLLVPAALAVPERDRGVGVAALVTACGALLLASAFADRAVTGSWVPVGWGGEEGRLLSEWEVGGADWRATAWNLVYFFVGGSVGVLPFFLPVVLLSSALDFGSRRSALAVTVGLAALAAVVLEPFNFWGGPGVGNRYLVPLYGALWLVPTRPLARGRMALAAAAAALFLWPSWAALGAFPLDGEGLYRHRAGLAKRYLPYETTQRELAHAGEARRQGIWIRSVNGTVTRQQGRWQVEDGGVAELLVAAAVPLDTIYLQFDATASTAFEVVGGTAGESIFRPDGRIGFQVRPEAPLARHATWWAREPQVLYLLEFRKPDAESSPLGFTLTGVTSARGG